MRALRDPLLRLAYRIGYRVLLVYGVVLRRPGRGVKCLIVRDGEVLLVRHTYGRRRVWRVPGGRSRRGESAVATAEREMNEELALSGLDWRLLATLELHLDGRAVSVQCLSAAAGDRVPDRDRAEIAEARFFAVAELPERLGAEEVRVLELLSLPFSGASRETSA